MGNAKGEVWKDKATGDWFWVEKRGAKHYISCWITCADAVRIVNGEKRAPRICRELTEIQNFAPVSKQVIDLLMKAVKRAEDDYY